MSKSHQFDHEPYLVAPSTSVDLSRFPTRAGDELEGKSEGKDALKDDVERLSDAQRVLWASQERAVLIIFQALDAAGKDGTIRHVMSGVNPQGVSVHGFRAPNEEELLHHFLWRPVRYLPGKGRIAIFNRSYYEEVLIVRVHPHFLDKQHLPPLRPHEDLWQRRFEEINNFERMLVRNGTEIIKFYLHLSRDEQRERFLDRIREPDKNWKFSEADVREREYWDDYRKAYEDMLSHTSTAEAPWHIIPADDKWFMRALVADIVSTRINALDLKPPVLPPEERKKLKEAEKRLLAEGK